VADFRDRSLTNPCDDIEMIDEHEPKTIWDHDVRVSPRSFQQQRQVLSPVKQ
jgi:hypothetical protein